MRNDIKKVSVADLEWTPAGAPGIFEKILNVDEATGARTLILKSVPRPGDQIVDRRPQFHPVAEEFFCLSGRFTLEGDPWFTYGSYVYYPPKVVHGFSVDVPDGYEIYLRNSGPLSTERVDVPTMDKLHFADSMQGATGHVILRQTDSVIDQMVRADEPSIAQLRISTDTGEGAFLSSLPRETRIEPPENGYEGFVELLMVRGEIELSGQGMLSTGEYAFVPPGTSVDFIGRDAASCFIVNHGRIDAFERFSRSATMVSVAGGIKANLSPI